MESVSGIKMSYTALYRKFRPQEFEDVKGKEHIVTTLKNQIKADRIWRMLSTPLFDSASISITFMELPAAIALQAGHSPHGLPSTGCSQLTAFANIFAMVVLPVPLGEVAGRLKTVDPDCQMIKEAKRIGISFGD